MNRRNLAFDRTNFILIGISFAIVVIGFLLMSGGSAEGLGFSDDIFSARRIKLAPAVCFVGFVSMIYAVVRKPKATADDEAAAQPEELQAAANEGNAEAKAEEKKDGVRLNFKH